MTMLLTKGQRIELLDRIPDLQRMRVGLGWDLSRMKSSQPFDLDTSAFLLNEAGRVQSERDFVFFNNLQGGNGSVVHSGDNRTGEGDGDDEYIKVDLRSVPASVHGIAIAITIYEAGARKQNFGGVKGAYVRLLNEDTGEELLRYELTEHYSTETAVVAAMLHRRADGEWAFEAVGGGYGNGLAGLCQEFGLQIG